MRKITLPVLLGLLLPLLPGQALAQFEDPNNARRIVSQRFFARSLDREFELNFRRVGAAALGMGGAHVASSRSLETMLWSPAGLAQAPGLRLAVDGSLNLNSQEVALQPLAGMKVVSEIAPRLLPGFAGAAYSFSLGGRRLTAGFAYHRMSPLAQKTTDTFYIYPAGTSAEVETPSGGLYAVSPLLAVDLLPQLSLGAGFHLLDGFSKYKLELKSVFLDQTVFYSFVDEEAYSGSFATVGIQARPMDWLALGVTLTPGWRFEIVEKSESVSLPTLVVADTIGVSYETPANLLNKFALELPMFYTVGLALKPLARLTLAFDYEARPWASARVSNNGVKQDASLLDGNAIHLGLEYRAATSGVEFPLRLGFYTDPSPYKDRYFKGRYLGRQIQTNVMTFGLGLHKAAWQVDMAFERGTREMQWWLSSGDFYNERLSTTELRFNEITFTLAYRF
ncbi:MAG: hypothetical protein ONB48_05105 [candidate division KSB1 bacterium]|nr:hypothetical protein [candidate division KSB1 bacterium]MDZ7276552.1 hypothetical protein [candidate division KSB1 bacterium]MDZ7285029.1 hypothetical protein [candidate division KSB1 bacterium]MDZ7298061.1 hypothetical protein [candidate division KSB1 bacterium]MDZ7307449.1 hypothetical protein [candidate division KSB1 bacterium]